MTVEKCYVGHSKNSLDTTDPSFLIHEVVSTFGQYVEFHVSMGTQEAVSQVRSGANSRQTAFDFLMQAQKNLPLPTLPERISARTRKDDLYNTITDLLEQMDLFLTSTEASAGGKQLVRALCNTLWYIDGRHDTFSARSLDIPDVFTQLQGYNRPELSKHWKRNHTNLNAVELRGLSSELFTVLLNPFFKKSPRWCMFQVQVELLAKNLASYADYLGEKSKHMKSHHSSSASSRQVEENLSFSFLPVSACDLLCWMP